MLKLGFVIKINNLCFVVSMERDRTSMLAPQNVRLQMFHNSQKGKKDEINFTLEVSCGWCNSLYNVCYCNSRCSIASW